jgi:hypothetical protein
MFEEFRPLSSDKRRVSDVRSEAVINKQEAETTFLTAHRPHDAGARRTQGDLLPKKVRHINFVSLAP